MTPGAGNLIRAQILAQLNTLKVSGVLSAVIEQDITANVLQQDFPGYPTSILGSSSLDAKWEYQQANKNTYTFNILVVQLVDNLPYAGYIEDLRDTIAQQFNNNFTLQGMAQLGIQAVMSPKIPVTERGKNYLIFYVTLRCTTLVNLTYSF